MNIVERAQGCLLGAAFGDSVGAAVEFMSESAIRDMYGERGVRTPLGFPGIGPGSITDDTQQALAVCRGLVHGRRRGGSKRTLTEDIWFALKRWCATQSSPHANRCPGFTSMSALARDSPGSFEDRPNSSDSCGAIMRVHPVGIYCAGRPVDAFELGVMSGVLTHGGIDGVAPAGVLAVIIAGLTGGREFDLACADGLDILTEIMPIAYGTIELARRALTADPQTTRADFGQGIQGWDGHEALAIGLLAARKHPRDLIEACSFAATHDGDSDSTASIAGAIVGALNGISCVPDEWRSRLEHADELLHYGEELVKN